MGAKRPGESSTTSVSCPAHAPPPSPRPPHHPCWRGECSTPVCARPSSNVRWSVCRAAERSVYVVGDEEGREPRWSAHGWAGDGAREVLLWRRRRGGRRAGGTQAPCGLWRRAARGPWKPPPSRAAPCLPPEQQGRPQLLMCARLASSICGYLEWIYTVVVRYKPVKKERFSCSVGAHNRHNCLNKMVHE